MSGEFTHYKERMQLAEMINDASIDRIWAIDTDFRIIAWNKTNEILSGVNKEDVLGKNIFTVIPQISYSTEIVKAIDNAMNGFKTFVPANKTFYDGGNFEYHFIPLRNNLETIIGVLNIVHDVAHRIKAENELARLNKSLERNNKELKIRNAELTSFTHVASHDLKEPLRKIHTFMEMMLVNEAEQMSEKGKMYFKRIQASIQRMEMLTDDIGAFANLEMEFTELSDIDLNSITKYVLNRLNEPIKQTNAVITSASLPVINGYRHLLSQLFKNIISNAIKFQKTDNIPVIDITSTIVNGNDIKHPDATPGIDYYRICFADNGIGFDNKYADRIFQMFQRLNSADAYDGTGIGLTICRKIAEIHHGFITADGKANEGSNFCVYLPKFIGSLVE